MSATIEERLARYTADLDRAVSDYSAHSSSSTPIVVASGPARPGGRGRRLVAAGVIACVVAAVAFVISTDRPDHDVNVSTESSVPTIGPVTTLPPHATTAPDSTTGPRAVTTAPTGTQQITYEPFTATGIDPALHVTARLTGTCISNNVGGRAYYRCFATSGGIYDPCFAGPHGTADPLVCPTNPATHDVIELTATSVTSDVPTSSTRLWAMQLSNGQVCQFASAAWGGLGPYACANGGEAQPVADCHEPVATQPWWDAHCQDHMTNASPFVATRVVKVWY